eukprot:12208-Heterococcus_DN1.PRE.2
MMQLDYMHTYLIHHSTTTTATADPHAHNISWRPDIPPYSIFDDADQDETMTNTTKVIDDPLRVDIDEVWDSIKYCSFLLEAEVSDSALFSLSKEILNDKGPLPVGEIGKLLQEFTANAGLSQTLKDQFGGLKRFLEKFPDDFLISTDHPFNPHVYLRAGSAAFCR